MQVLKRCFLALLMSVAMAPTGHAGLDRWTGGGVEGGSIRDLVSDSSASNRFYAATVNGPFRSDDGGQTWSRVANGANNTISRLAIADDGVLYALDFGVIGDNGALLKSTDGGASWVELAPPAGDVTRVAVAASESTRVLLRYNGDEIYLSTDGGATFTLSQAGLPVNKENVEFDPLDAQVAYCATNDGVYRSTDGGVSWHPRNTNGVAVLSEIAIARSDTSVLLAGGGSTTLLSIDAGATWNEVTEVSGASRVFIAPSNALNMAAIDGREVWLSADGGATWSTDAPFAPLRLLSLAFDRWNPTQMLLGVNSIGIGRSADGGASWVVSSSGINASSLWNKSVRSTVSTAYQWNGLFRSEDAGATWSPIYEGLPGQAGVCAVDPSAVEHAACVGEAGWLYETTDGGAIWTDESPTPFSVNLFIELEIDPQNSLRWGLGNIGLDLGGGMMDPTLAFSIDGGSSWQTTLEVDPSEWVFYAAYSIRFSPTDSNLVWASGFGTRQDFSDSCWARRSLDGGTTWEEPVEFSATSCFAQLKVDLFNPQNVYLLTVAGSVWEVYRSTDSGQTWTPLDIPTAEIFSLAVNPLNGELYVGAEALYRSSDGGASWEAFPTTGLSDEVRFVSSIDVSATDPPTLWISTNAGSYTYTGFGQEIFADGFESGDTSAWSSVVP